LKLGPNALLNRPSRDSRLLNFILLFEVYDLALDRPLRSPCLTALLFRESSNHGMDNTRAIRELSKFKCEARQLLYNGDAGNLVSKNFIAIILP
jgi:hypothetical protein